MIIALDDPVSTGAQRFEVFTGEGRRLEWAPEFKAAIVAECNTDSEPVWPILRHAQLPNFL